eukprot:TRINITY_DN54730_c0_g1_i1.p1 TRINITY_DN54730_c0_g1~~TRINITY_DN54730_c0_g1_i1.p1  ORF type:complete len:199 (-),score=31.78 TRINITY_DN54730_c0_g1_i1:137-733(-)
MADALQDAAHEAVPGWRTPYWQAPVRTEELALHHDGPLRSACREGYLQKRAGKSRLRWNIRYFEIKDGLIRWWRPAFKDQLMQPGVPRVALKEPRPAPIRCLDCTKIRSVTRTKVKFPYSTRILIRWQEDYTDYALELRSEKELDIIEWYKLLLRFTMEHYEVEVDAEAASTADNGGASTADAGSESDSDRGGGNDGI